MFGKRLHDTTLFARQKAANQYFLRFVVPVFVFSPLPLSHGNSESFSWALSKNSNVAKCKLVTLFKRNFNIAITSVAIYAPPEREGGNMNSKVEKKDIQTEYIEAVLELKAGIAKGVWFFILN